MKKILLLILLSISVNAFSQIKIVQGIIRSETDSLPLDSVIVLIRSNGFHDRFNDGIHPGKIIFVLTDSTGKFEFHDITVPGLVLEGKDANNRYLTFEIFRNGYYEGFYSQHISNDSLMNLVYYLPPLKPDTSFPINQNFTSQYAGCTLFGGFNFNQNTNQAGYKLGESMMINWKVSPINYIGMEIGGFYKKYSLSKDSSNTGAIYSKEYFSALEVGVGTYFRTHIFSWKKQQNALALDLGVEYDLPLSYRYINIIDRSTKMSIKNFHKYNEFYANARIGLLKGLAIKGQYRLTDIFKSQMEELPRWSIEFHLQLSFPDDL